LTVSLPDGSYDGFITAVKTDASGAGTITFDPETLTADGTSAVDVHPHTYRIGVGPQTVVEISSGYNAAAAHTNDTPWGPDFGSSFEADDVPNTLTAFPSTYLVTVTGGDATFIKQFNARTPSCGHLGGTDEPSSPSDRSPVVFVPATSC
jgi:hypothetical protein